MRKIEFTPLKLHPKGNCMVNSHLSRKPKILRHLFFYKLRRIPKKERDLLYNCTYPTVSLSLSLTEKAALIRFLCAKFKEDYYSSLAGYFAFDFKSNEGEIFSIRLSKYTFNLAFTIPIKDNNYGNFDISTIWAELTLHRIIFLCEKLGLAIRLSQPNLEGDIQHSLCTAKYENLKKWLRARYKRGTASEVLSKIESRDIGRLEDYIKEKNPSLVFASAGLKAADRRFKRFLHYLFEPIQTEKGLIHFNFKACSKKS